MLLMSRNIGWYLLISFADYPHSAGTWSWDDEADQVILVVQNIRRSLVEYSDIMWLTSDESQGSKKETICHRTMSKTNPWVEITVSVNALQTHLDHGDKIGACGKF